LDRISGKIITAKRGIVLKFFTQMGATTNFNSFTVIVKNILKQEWNYEKL
jgi:hypothetical protein